MDVVLEMAVLKETVLVVTFPNTERCIPTNVFAETIPEGMIVDAPSVGCLGRLYHIPRFQEFG